MLGLVTLLFKATDAGVSGVVPCLTQGRPCRGGQRGQQDLRSRPVRLLALRLPCTFTGPWPRCKVRSSRPRGVSGAVRGTRLPSFRLCSSFLGAAAGGGGEAGAWRSEALRSRMSHLAAPTFSFLWCKTSIVPTLCSDFESERGCAGALEIALTAL